MQRPFFLGREQLLANLTERFKTVREDDRGQLLAVRGRRQVGKSRLFTEFVETSGFPYIFISSLRNATLARQMEEIQAAAHESHKPLPNTEQLFGSSPSSWSDALDRIALGAQKSPMIVVIDEFPWAARTDPVLESLLQHTWDKTLEHLPILFVLIGSDVTMMERLSQYDRPLYGRTREIKVGPFNPSECAKILGTKLSPMAILDTFLLTGGYPRLVTEAAKASGPVAFAKKQLTDETSELVVMGQISLDAEFPEGDASRRVLSAIGANEIGALTFSQIANNVPGETATSQTSVTRALKTLVEKKGLVAAEAPIGASHKTKLRRYRIADSYLRFWFRFIEENRDDISRGRPDITIDNLERNWSTWRGKAIEPVVREAVFRLGRDVPLLKPIDDVGSWWTRDNRYEYDLVASSDRGSHVTFVGSIKWRDKKKMTAAEIADLAEATNIIPKAGRASLLAVCPAGFEEDVTPDLVITPEQILSAWKP